MQVINRLKVILNKLKKSNAIEAKLLRGMSWNLVGSVLAKMLTIVVSILTARILSATVYGQYGMINSTVLMFSTFAGLGLGITTTRYVAEYKNSDKERAGRIIGLTNILGLFTGLFMMFVLFFSSDWLATNQLHDSSLSFALKVSSFLLLFNTITGVQTGTLAGFEDFKSIAYVAMIQGIISFPLVLGGVYIYGLHGLIVANVIVSLIGVIRYRISLLRVLRRYKVISDYRNAFKEISVVWKTSIPSMFSNIMVSPVLWLCNSLIISIPNGYYYLGLFNAANQWRTMLTFLPRTIGQVMLPLLISSQDKDNEKIEKLNVLLSWSIVIFLSIPILVFPESIAFLYGEKYKSQSFIIVLILTALLGVIYSYREGITRNLVKSNKMWWVFYSNMVWAILMVIFVYKLKDLGAIGLSISYVSSYLIGTLIFVPYYIRKKVVLKELIVSKEVGFIWLIIIILMTCSFFQVNMLIRGLALPIIIFIMVLVIKKILVKPINVEGKY